MEKIHNKCLTYQMLQHLPLEILHYITVIEDQWYNFTKKKLQLLAQLNPDATKVHPQSKHA